ncbi:hypothetical protein [Nocardia noduli]|uniref:hypothetical protein n=1 Tax=Nocardia noduli TaxID=2815722 RepID=UPI001C24B071|nr:hypothetical protein [Nocardia noduli]
MVGWQKGQENSDGTGWFNLPTGTSGSPERWELTPDSPLLNRIEESSIGVHTQTIDRETGAYSDRFTSKISPELGYFTYRNSEGTTTKLGDDGSLVVVDGKGELLVNRPAPKRVYPDTRSNWEKTWDYMGNSAESFVDGVKSLVGQNSKTYGDDSLSPEEAKRLNRNGAWLDMILMPSAVLFGAALMVEDGYNATFGGGLRDDASSTAQDNVLGTLNLFGQLAIGADLSNFDEQPGQTLSDAVLGTSLFFLPKVPRAARGGTPSPHIPPAVRSGLGDFGLGFGSHPIPALPGGYPRGAAPWEKPGFDMRTGGDGIPSSPGGTPRNTPRDGPDGPAHPVPGRPDQTPNPRSAPPPLPAGLLDPHDPTLNGLGPAVEEPRNPDLPSNHPGSKLGSERPSGDGDRSAGSQTPPPLRTPEGYEPGAEPGTWYDSNGNLRGPNGQIMKNPDRPVAPESTPSAPRQKPRGLAGWVDTVRGEIEDFFGAFRPGALADEVKPAIPGRIGKNDDVVPAMIKGTEAFQPSWYARWQINRTLRERAEAIGARDELLRQRDNYAMEHGVADPAFKIDGSPKNLSSKSIEDAIENLRDSGRKMEADELAALDDRARGAITPVTNASEKLGVIGARDYINQLGGKVIYVGPGGRDHLDVVGVIDGKLMVIEAKGGGARLGARWVSPEEGLWHNEQQGTAEYLRYLMRTDEEFLAQLRVTNPELVDAVEAGDLSNVEYKLVKVGEDGQATVSEFDIEGMPRIPIDATHFGGRAPFGKSVPQNTTPPAGPIAWEIPRVSIEPWSSGLGAVFGMGSVLGTRFDSWTDSLIGFTRSMANPPPAPTPAAVAAIPSAPAILFANRSENKSMTVNIVTPHIDSSTPSPQEAVRVLGLGAHLR